MCKSRVYIVKRLLRKWKYRSSLLQECMHSFYVSKGYDTMCIKLQTSWLDINNKENIVENYLATAIGLYDKNCIIPTYQHWLVPKENIHLSIFLNALIVAHVTLIMM